MKIPSKNYRPGDPAVYAHCKLDGHFTRVVRDGEVRVYSSQDTPIELPPHMKAHLYRYLPDGVTILGELHAPGFKSCVVKTMLKQQDPRLRFDGFAIERTPLRLCTESLECAELAEVRDLLLLWGIQCPPFVVLQDGWSPEQLLAATTGEGYVLKDGNLLNWRKLKHDKTIDLIVSGWTEGTGSNLGLVGGLVCRMFEGYEVANVKLRTDEMREQVSEDVHQYIGRIVEVKYQYLGSGGRLRHPRLIGFRDDKSHNECGISQESELEAYYADR